MSSCFVVKGETGMPAAKEDGMHAIVTIAITARTRTSMLLSI